jgi:hypothetical protein
MYTKYRGTTDLRNNTLLVVVSVPEAAGTSAARWTCPVTVLTVPSGIAPCIRWSAMPDNTYAAIPPGKQVMSGVPVWYNLA